MMGMGLIALSGMTSGLLTMFEIRQKTNAR
jgi:hypothetical protein